MLSFPAAIKVYLGTVACDMRRSFDGLAMMAEHLIPCDPFSGHLLVFCQRRSDRVKILYGDRDGWAIWYNLKTSPSLPSSSEVHVFACVYPGSWPPPGGRGGPSLPAASFSTAARNNR